MRVAKFKKCGMTLMEMLTVVLILVVLSLLSLGAFSRQHQVSLLHNEALKVQATLGLARSRAISQNVPYQFDFWTTNPSFWIDRLAGDGLSIDQSRETTPGRVDPLVVIDVVVSPPNAFPATSLVDIVSIRFQPDGSSEDAVIHLIRAGADASDPTQFYSVKLYGPSGNSRIFPNVKL